LRPTLTASVSLAGVVGGASALDGAAEATGGRASAGTCAADEAAGRRNVGFPVGGASAEREMSLGSSTQANAAMPMINPTCSQRAGDRAKASTLVLAAKGIAETYLSVCWVVNLLGSRCDAGRRQAR